MINALIGVAMLGAMTAGYVALARRYCLLWHPAAIVAAVTAVSIAVSIAGVVLFGAGLVEVPAMLRRSALGGFGWGMVIAAIAWAARRGYSRWHVRGD